MTRDVTRSVRSLAIFGVVTAAAALFLALIDTRAALTGWLAAAVFVQALPTGALTLLLMMRLIRGKWERDLAAPARLATAIVPLAALALVPVLLGMATIYPWFDRGPESAFAKFWLNPVFFAGRTAAWFVFIWFAAKVATRGSTGEGKASALLIVLVLDANFMANDWLMSLDPNFASSGFGMQVFAMEVCAALAALILLRLAGGKPQYSGVLGGLLLTLLLLWAYFQFMPFLIVWSGNLPEGVTWYMARAAPGWKAAFALAALLGGAPLLALLASDVRKNPRWLRLCAASVLVGKAIEFGWLALPGRSALAVVAAMLALAGLGTIAAATLLRMGQMAESGS